MVLTDTRTAINEIYEAANGVVKMLKSSINQNESERYVNPNVLDEVVFHDQYDVKDDNGGSVGINLLYQYYGELWISAMNRLDHKIDGHLFDLRHEGISYGVYRNLRMNQQEEEHPHLRLIKKT